MHKDKMKNDFVKQHCTIFVFHCSYFPYLLSNIWLVTCGLQRLLDIIQVESVILNSASYCYRFIDAYAENEWEVIGLCQMKVVFLSVTFGNLACVLMIDSVMPFRSGLAHGGHQTPFYYYYYQLNILQVHLSQSKEILMEFNITYMCTMNMLAL